MAPQKVGFRPSTPRSAHCQDVAGPSSSSSASSPNVARLLNLSVARRRHFAARWEAAAREHGWTTDELYVAGRGANVLAGDRVAFIDERLIMAVDKDGVARPIYRGVDYGL